MILQLQPPLLESIKKALKDDPKYRKFRRQIKAKQRTSLSTDADGFTIQQLAMCSKEKFDRKYCERLIVHLILFISVEQKYQDLKKHFGGMDEVQDCQICIYVFCMSASKAYLNYFKHYPYLSESGKRLPDFDIILLGILQVTLQCG